MADESWAWAPGYVGRYLVSDRGRVMSLPADGRRGRVLATTRQDTGYEKVNLSRDGEVRSLKVHRLVLEAFRGRMPEGTEVNHRNGDKADNRLENLEAVTHAQNMAHARDELRRTFGRKLDMARARLVRESDVPARVLAERFGVSAYTIRAIKRNERYREAIDG